MKPVRQTDLQPGGHPVPQPSPQTVPHPAPQPEQAPDRGPSPFSQTARAVGWSFFGVRRAAGLAHDVQRLNPVHVVIGGVLGAAVFVVVLVLLVNWVVGSGVAG